MWCRSTKQRKAAVRRRGDERSRAMVRAALAAGREDLSPVLDLMWAHNPLLDLVRLNVPASIDPAPFEFWRSAPLAAATGQDIQAAMTALWERLTKEDR